LPEGTRIMILSPLVIERKGEQLDLFDELRAQGFTRLRINGKVYEIDALPALQKTKKHTVEIVVDRLKVNAESKQRLAESFETALRHADARVAEMDMARRSFREIRSSDLVQLLAAGTGTAPVRSTIRWARARSATGSATSVSSTRNASSPSRSFR
jgi:excinuclease UvrABC ATPase subunit